MKTLIESKIKKFREEFYLNKESGKIISKLATEFRDVQGDLEDFLENALTEIEEKSREEERNKPTVCPFCHKTCYPRKAI